jgi:hypothetical protein
VLVLLWLVTEGSRRSLCASASGGGGAVCAHGGLAHGGSHGKAAIPVTFFSAKAYDIKFFNDELHNRYLQEGRTDGCPTKMASEA